VAIVTGGARGIGEAIVRAYAAEGVRVMIADIEFAKAQEMASEFGTDGLAVQLDVRDSKSISALIATTASKCGGVEYSSTTRLSSTWRRFRRFPNRVSTTIHRKREGIFLYIASGRRANSLARPGWRNHQYGVTGGLARRSNCRRLLPPKAAGISLTQSAGLGLMKNGINVNDIAPGVVYTPVWSRVDCLFAKYEYLPLRKKKCQVGAAVPAARMGTPEDYRGVAIFF
jgi:NAD(P)-dependent dehydrogenase (short-subunit alcohol dehydrogenase family)